jgi:hypothetical protein
VQWIFHTLTIYATTGRVASGFCPLPLPCSAMERHGHL